MVGVPVMMIYTGKMLSYISQIYNNTPQITKYYVDNVTKWAAKSHCIDEGDLMSAAKSKMLECTL